MMMTADCYGFPYDIGHMEDYDALCAGYNLGLLVKIQNDEDHLNPYILQDVTIQNLSG